METRVLYPSLPMMKSILPVNRALPTMGLVLFRLR